MFHKANIYLYPPGKLEEMPLYMFYLESKYVNISVATKLGLKYSEYRGKYAFQQSLFPWVWLSFTKSFLTSILDPIDKAVTPKNKMMHLAFCNCFFLSVQEKAQKQKFVCKVPSRLHAMKAELQTK
jgi:hypothetical protein